MWSDVESYQQLEQEYKRALDEYNNAEAEYREALAASNDPSALAPQYERLEKMRRSVESIYDRLTRTRSELATSREKRGPGSGG